jgi:NAD(P) transhydrogenase subunit alpha
VIAIAFGTINIVGGFLVTDRMLEMFKVKPKRPADHGGADGKGDADGDGDSDGSQA